MAAVNFIHDTYSHAGLSGSHAGLESFGRPEFDAGRLVEASVAVTPPKYRLVVFGGAVLFAAGIVAGLMLGQDSPQYPPSPNICRADEVGHRTDCVPAPQAPAPAVVAGVTQ
ncbi:MAG: hypothetical protein J2P18_07530 [Nocardia sp.]|nr:hypothetical protein [Nocardia sp.]